MTVFRGTFLALLDSLPRLGSAEALFWPWPLCPVSAEALSWPWRHRLGSRLESPRHFFGPGLSAPFPPRHFLGLGGIGSGPGSSLRGTFLALASLPCFRRGTFLALEASAQVQARVSEALFWPWPLCPASVQALSWPWLRTISHQYHAVGTIELFTRQHTGFDSPIHERRGD
ncbi:hypothetical protein B0G52_11152 [Cohnella sp. SGD-V74]|nr:hypothetical protein B0G52_11152 [Cohnella sp. SGD-V74]